MRATLIISNDRHHAGIARPVGRELLARGHRVTVLSLCELRGTSTPTELLMADGFEVRRVMPRVRREKGARADSGRDRLRSRVARKVVWRVLELLSKDVLLGSDVVLLMNDHAYPYLDLAQGLLGHGVPFVLAQEGVRFSMPQEDETQFYGRGGAHFVAVWGETSAEHFETRGTPRSRIRVTGCPRFDDFDPAPYRTAAAELAKKLELEGKTLLGYFSNLVDMQGFCTTRERIELFGRFLDGVRPLLEDDPNLRIGLRLHPAEDPSDFVQILETRPFAGQRVIDANKYELFPLILNCRAVVVLSSTIGLEAGLVDRPVGVVEMPGHGYAHDYVDLGIGRPLSWSEPLAPQVAHLLGSFADESRAAREEYVRRSLRRDGPAARQIADVLEDAARLGRPSIPAQVFRTIDRVRSA